METLHELDVSVIDTHRVVEVDGASINDVASSFRDEISCLVLFNLGEETVIESVRIAFAERSVAVEEVLHDLISKLDSLEHQLLLDDG